MKKITTALLALLVVCCMVSACGPSASAVTGGSAQSSASKASDYEYARISWFFTASMVMIPPDCFPVAKALEDINVEWVPMNPTSSDYEGMLMAAIAAGDTPDIIYTVPSITLNLYNEQLIIPLEDYLNDKYIPNVIKHVKSWDKYLPTSKYPDGHIYTVNSVGNTDGLPDTAHWIRTDWLEKLGLAIPTDYNELSDVLIAFAKAGS